MTTRKGFFTGIIASMFGGAAAARAIGPAAAKNNAGKWAYKLVLLIPARSEEEYRAEFNALGDEAWELVSINYDRAFFKKPTA